MMSAARRVPIADREHIEMTASDPVTAGFVIEQQRISAAATQNATGLGKLARRELVHG
jgi:hypothetical protein